MAGLFGKKGPSEVEMRREADIKKNITQEFSRALKTLQREHINSSEPIYSDDLANSVCNILEAVFLHGLKGSVTKMITTYLVGKSTESEVLNFWQLVKKFSHSDVVSQLNHLGQITTEIGMCRAWVRLALNDCLMESYVDAMIADKRTLAYYYKRTAYLRDLEQPGILKSYLQGLGEFHFQLSYNSSVLNLWTTAPLTLSGIWQSQVTPNAVISPVSDLRSASIDSCEQAIPDHPSTEETSPVVSRSKARSSSNEKTKKKSRPLKAERSQWSSSSTPGPPPNTPYDESILTNKAADELRTKLMIHSSSPTNSDTSTSSHISCPDPSDLDAEKAEPSKSRNIEAPKLFKDKIAPCLATDNDELKLAPNPVFDVSQSPIAVLQGLEVERRKSLPLEPALTQAVATMVETVQPSLPSRPLTLLSVANKNQRSESVHSDFDPMKSEAESTRRESVDVLSDGGSEPNYQQRMQPKDDVTDGSSVGNSLGKMSGWSSSFDHQSFHGNQPTSTSAAVPIEQRDRVLSYGTLLQNYTPSSSVTSPSMQEVLKTLGDSEKTSEIPPPFPQEPSIEESASGSDFEIITPYTSDMIYASSKMYESQIAIMGQICNEKGLDIQNYQCKGCARPVGLIYGSPRVCSYDGGYYCYECHENDEYYIPSRIIYNWDFRKHKVAKRNLEFLMEVEDHPLLDLEALNPKVYDHVNEMNDVKILREQLCYVKSYLFTCKQSVADDLKKSIWPKEYLYDQLHLYSLNDLLQVMTGTLAGTLKKLVKFATRHIYECGLCSQKGFICEICNNPQVIYPFETDTTERCTLCRTVYHRSCKQEVKKCPKCQRRMQRHSKVGGEIITPDSDYANHPDDQF